jgi:hypothetical protein
MYLKGQGMQRGQNFVYIYSVGLVVYVKYQNELDKKLIYVLIHKEYFSIECLIPWSCATSFTKLFVSKYLRLLQDLTLNLLAPTTVGARINP